MNNNTNIIVSNDSQSHTVINLNIDNSKISHKQLNKLITELHDLGLKYSIISVKEGACND
jgi:hypothetical protein